MKPDKPPGQKHRRHVEQFIGKCPPKRTQSQLEHVGRNRDGEREPDALSRENRERKYVLEYFRHFANEYTVGWGKHYLAEKQIKCLKEGARSTVAETLDFLMKEFRTHLLKYSVQSSPDWIRSCNSHT